MYEFYTDVLKTLFCRFHYVLKTLAESEDGQICLLKTLYEVWSTHQQVKMLKIAIDPSLNALPDDKIFLTGIN